MSAEKTRVALVQMRCGPQPDANLARAIDLIERAAGDRAQIVCLPELFRSQYFCQSENHDNFALAEPIPGPSTEALGKIAREHEINQHLISRWCRQHRRYKERAFSGNGKPHTDEARLAALERKVGQLTMENDLLKKLLQKLEQEL